MGSSVQRVSPQPCADVDFPTHASVRIVRDAVGTVPVLGSCPWEEIVRGDFEYSCFCCRERRDECAANAIEYVEAYNSGAD